MSEIFRIFTDEWTPPDENGATRWCEEHIHEIPYSPIPGRFRRDNNPMIPEIIEAIVSPRVRSVSVVASVQSGKTLAAELSLAYIVANLPGPALWVTAKDDDAKTEGESRLLPLLENCPPAKKLFPTDKNKKRNRAVFFENGMTLWLVGANNRRNLQSRSIRWLFGDELWLWPQGRLREAEARVSAFGRLGKCVFFSQGSIAGDDCDRKFQATDRREWHFCCPECGALQAYKWENIHWDAAAKNETTGEWDFRRVKATANLSCEVCGHAFRDTPGERSRLNSGGKFVAQNPNASAEHVGFHWNALATMSWGELAETFLRAKAEARKGRTEDLAAFYQQRLALAWCEDSDYSADEVFENQPSGNTYLMGASDWELEGVADAASRRFVPAREHTDAADAPRLRFLTVDVQDGYFVYVVRAWSPAGGRSRLIWCGIAQTFGDLADIRTKFCVPAKFVFIDAGFATQRVFAWCAETGAIAFQGDRAGKANYRHPDGKFRFYSPKRLARAGNASRAAETYFFSNISCKDKLSDLRREGGDVWGLPADIPEEYVKQLGAEYRSNVNGKPIWLKRGNRANHYWDCEVMQVAAAFLMKVF
ncbi:MAG: phage terminase large subunit family protein [Opitutales bacterium]|nr:phage terminase large subunit family protein [Opitutales bacterium]